jgi:BirA family biotin operon repressor/biotin-[acetyl-CoA-carboxylase] ligase
MSRPESDPKSGFEPLSRAAIEAALTPAVLAQQLEIDRHSTLDSTNAELLRQINSPTATYHRPKLCLAETQTGGRGRRGRSWYSPPGANLYSSLLWGFQQPPAQLLGLSALTAIAVAQALRELGAVGIGLKWPNDLLWQDRKLAGILLESSSTDKMTFVVAGIGLNVAMPPDNPIDQAWTDLHQVLGRFISRNTLVAALLNQLVPLYQQVQQGHWPDLALLWSEYDVCANQAVQLHTTQQTLQGLAQGIDANGALLLSRDGGLQTFTSGEVSLRRL